MESRVWRAVAVLVAVTTALLGGSQAWAAMVHQATVIEGRPYHARIGELVLDSGSADVEVDPGPTDEVTVRQILSWTMTRPKVAMIWDRDTLRIAVKCPRILGVDEPGCAARLEIMVPAETRVSGRSTSGQTSVRNLAGDIHLQTGSGSIDLVRVAGQVWAESNSGQVTGRALSSPQVRAATGSGEVELSFDQAPKAVTLFSSSGDLALTVPAQSRYDISGRTASGSRSIDPELADSESPNKIDIVTNSGSATVGWPRADSPPSAPAAR